MGKFSPTKLKGNCEEIANPSTAYGRRQRNWIDAHAFVPPGQVVDASCGNKRCIALGHAYLRPRVEQPGKYRKIAERVHRLKVGQHFDVRGLGTDERSRNRFRSGLYAAGQGLGARAAGRQYARHQGRGMVETWVTSDAPSMLSLRSSGFWIHFGYSFCRISLASGLTWAYLD